MTWIWWAPLMASLVHIFEEFVYRVRRWARANSR